MSNQETFSFLKSRLEALLTHSFLLWEAHIDFDPDKPETLSVLAIGPTTYLNARAMQHNVCPEDMSELSARKANDGASPECGLSS